ncbi:MAG: Phosphoribosyl-AMP cyclohydrolase [Elusimicrobia bacterium]|nr:Phosphoribosyl-AMP cyclohydrolase [Elusimicrobiota bacterium]
MNKEKEFDLADIKFDANGLVPAIAQDHKDGTILMLAYMNLESLKMTLQTGTATYWSRSRQKFWKKGEESGNVQLVKAVYKDCDSDAILIKVDQIGGAACHTGQRSCFYRQSQEDGGWKEISQPLFDPKQVYKK